MTDMSWLAKRASVRKYWTKRVHRVMHRGFNHKSIGMDAGSVVAYMDIAIRKKLHINPNTQTFTVNLFGGPTDKDTSNIIRILIRDYGDNCKIIGVCDPSASVQGTVQLLNHTWCLA